MKEDQHSAETTKASVDWRKMPRKRPDKDEKHLAYSILIANGVQKEKAATMLGYSPRTVRSIDRALVKKSLKLELLSEQRIQRAHRVVDKILAGRTFGCIETVRASDSLRAAEAIIDRSSPKAEVPPATTYQFTKVDLNLFRCDYNSPAESPNGEPLPITLGEESGPDEEPK